MKHILGDYEMYKTTCHKVNKYVSNHHADQQIGQNSDSQLAAPFSLH